jgi:predicted ABC-type ATPase
VKLLFFWLRNVDLAIERVKTRVKEGGHNIELTTIRRRYKNGITNLYEIYLPIVDEAMIIDNSEGQYELIAEKNKESDLVILDIERYNNFKRSYHEKA